jgi:hypothetical protein
MERIMRRLFVMLAAIFAVLIMSSGNAFAGSPHFVGVQSSVSGNTLTVSGKEAGLGNETQVHIVVTATAECINGGSHHPKAANKTSVAAEGDFPVQNGQATFSLSVTASFQPDCSPPMSVVFSNITVSDTEHGVSASIG